MTTDFLESFGRAVRQLRQHQGITQADLADRLSLGRTSVTNMEKGRQNPPLSALPDIASALGVDIVQLLRITVGEPDDVPGDEDPLASRVMDKDLRRWAGQVIGDTLAHQGSTLASPSDSGRTP